MSDLSAMNDHSRIRHQSIKQLRLLFLRL